MFNNELKELILSYLESKDMNSLKQILSDADERDIIEIIEELSNKERAIVFRLLSKETSLLVFEQLDVYSQEKLILSFAEEKAIEMIEELEPDDRVRLLDELPSSVAEKMLASLSPVEREMTNLLMGYEAETAGRIMTPQYVRLRKDMTAAEALDAVKKSAKEKETIYTLFVTDNSRNFEGVLSLKDLIIANPNDKIENLMETNIIKVSTDTEQEEVARTLKDESLLSIPVVDKTNRLVGIITVDDCMEILDEEATEDILCKAGLAKGRGESCRSEAMIKGSLWSVWRVRMPFLIITLFGGLLAGSVMGFFENTLKQILIAAMFIPVVMDMGGNVGVQSSTIFQRGALLGHISNDKIKRHILRETTIGLSMGIVVGIICGFAAFGISAIGFMGGQLNITNSALLGVAVGISLITVMTLAATIGFVVPYVLMKLNIDQAAATDPIITSIKDISGLAIYFGLISVLLSHLL